MNKSLSFKITPLSLLKFTLPSMGMMLVMALYTVVDGIMVSRLINTEAFSAVNIVFPLSGIVVAIGTMFGTGTAAIVSRKLGEGREKEAKEILTFIILATVIVGIVLTAVCLPLADKIIRLLGAEGEIIEYCRQYAVVLILFFPASILQLQFQCLFAANGKPNLGLITTVSGGVANIILDYLFISVCGMGIAGAAVATGIGYCIPAIFGLFYFSINRKNSLYFVRPKAAFKHLFTAMANGSSEMVSNVSTSVTTLLFNLIMMRLVGFDGVAAIGVILYMDFVFVAINLGYSIGVASLISYNYGCMDKDKQRKIFKNSMIFCFGLGILTAIAAFVFAPQFSGIFAEQGSAVYSLAVQGLSVFSVCYLFKGFNIYASSMFTAFSNGLISALISVCRSLIFLIAALLTLSALLGVLGVWLAIPVAELLTLAVSVVCIVKYAKRYGYNKNKDRAVTLKT